MTVDDILQWLADHFEEPCNYTFDDVDVPIFILDNDPDYCEKHCGGKDTKECWRKYLELYFERKAQVDALQLVCNIFDNM